MANYHVESGQQPRIVMQTSAAPKATRRHRIMHGSHRSAPVYWFCQGCERRGKTGGGKNTIKHRKTCTVKP